MVTYQLGDWIKAGRHLKKGYGPPALLPDWPNCTLNTYMTQVKVSIQ